MKPGSKILWVFISLVIGIIACDNETKVCDQSLTTSLQMRFYKPDSSALGNPSGNVRDTTLRNVTLFALTKNKDSIYKSVPASRAYLSLNLLNDTSQFYLRIDSFSVPDTINFYYKRSRHFVSPGCGFATFFVLDAVTSTHNSIDSLKIILREVNADNDTNINLYF